MNKNTKLVMLAILSLAFVSQANTIVSVMLADIAKDFPNASQTALQYIMQMGMIGAFPISLAAGFLANKIPKKYLVLTGLVLIVLGGLIPIINHSSITILYVGALFVGAGQGFLMPLLGALIIENFQGKEQHAMMGYNTAASSTGSTVLLLLAGMLCKQNWVNVFYLYFIALIVMIIVIVFLPKKVVVSVAPSNDTRAKSKSPVPAKGWIQCTLGAFMFMTFATFAINISLYIDAKGLGDARTTSLVMALVTGFGIVAGLIFNHVLKITKFYITSFAALLGTLGIVAVCLATNIVLIYVATFFIGLFFGFSNSGGMYVISRICTPEQIGPTFSILMSLVTVGVILSPLVINGITAAWGGVGSIGSFVTSAVLFAIITIISVFWNTYLTKSLSLEADNSVLCNE